MSKKYKVNQGCMSLSAYYVEDGRHLARLRRRRAIPLAMITTRKSIHGFPSVSFMGMGLRLAFGPPELRYKQKQKETVSY